MNQWRTIRILNLSQKNTKISDITINDKPYVCLNTSFVKFDEVITFQLCCITYENSKKNAIESENNLPLPVVAFGILTYQIMYIN